MTSSEDEEEHSDTPTGSTDTNICTLPLMCVCLLGDMEKPSRIHPEPLTQSQKHRRQLGDLILRKVMAWVGKGEKPSKKQLKGRPADLQAYWNVWELLRIKDGVLYRLPLDGGAEHLDKLRWCVPTNSVTDVLLVAHMEEGVHMAVESTLNRSVQFTWWPTQRKDVADFCAACPGCKSKVSTSNKVTLSIGIEIKSIRAGLG